MERESVEKIKWLADSMLDNFPGCIMRVVYTDEEMWMEYVSEGVERLFGETPELYKDKINNLARGHVATDSAIWGKEFVEEAVRTGKGLRREYLVKCKDDEERWIEVRSTIVSCSDEQIVMQYVVLDIDEQKRAEERVKKEHERLEVVAGLSANSVFEYDIAEDCMRYYNRKEILIDSLRYKPVIENYTERILSGSIMGELFHPDDTEKIWKLCEDFRNGKPEIYSEIRKQYEENKYTWVSVEAKTMLDKQGKPSHVIGKISNIDEKIKQEQEIKYQMERDQLTGLYNKQTVEKLISEKLAEGVGESAYLVLTDVDEFKSLNDTLGHLFGDGVLCTFANSMVEIFPEAIIGRTGGDEFIAFFEGLEQADVLARINRINRRLSRIHAGDNDELKISVSFGYVQCEPGTDNNLEELKDKADVALCHLKQNSKGTAALYNTSMKHRHVHKEHREEQAVANETVLHTENDLMLFAHELFDNLKDIRGALRLLSDVITRFYHFQDILFVHKRKSGNYEIMYHWGEHNTDQFYLHPLSPYGEPDWEKLLYKDDENEYVVLTEDDFVGENVNKAKSMISFHIKDTEDIGYCVLVDRCEKRSWKKEIPTLSKLADFVVKRYFMQLEKQRQEEEAEYKSKFDHLTGLMNLSHFTSVCEQYIKGHPQQKFALLYSDFTNFKFFNETYGYNVGNKILKEYAEILKKNPAVCRCRITADSFVSLYGIEDVEEVKEIFYRRGADFCEAAHRYYPKCKLGLAGGITVVDRSLDSISHNIDNANTARKLVKKDATTIQAEVYTAELREEQQKQIEILSHMTEALENHEFKVFLQPKMNMFTDKVIGAEALVRWFKQDGTMVSPGEFIPIFEENGFVTHLDFEMMRQVLDMQQKRLNEGKPIVNISVNFSRKHQEDKAYLERLDELMAQYEVPAKSLEIEITESVFMQDLAPLIDSICQLKKRGFSVSIDDFGAGYSSLNVLSKVKADIVKLDRQFLLDVEMEKDNFSSEFLQLLINMIKQLGFRVLAEGVETAEQVALLKNAGCRFAQGFYYARPMPIEEFLEFLDRHEIEEN